MDWTQKCAAVIPCYNEAARIGEVVAGVRRHLLTVIVVDDGSLDSTADTAMEAGAEVVRLPQNTGKGAALRAGWQHALDRGFTWALNLDGDGQHAPGDIPKFFQHVEQSRAAMVVGNRMDHAEAMPWLRRRVNHWMTRRLSRFTGVSLVDSQCGFRLLDLEVVARVPMTANHFEIESEVLVALLAARCPVEFVPVQVLYKSGHSKIHPLVDSWRWLRWWFAQRQPLAADAPLVPRPQMYNLPEPHA
ncbi:MAG: glycosyltransferase family 2 protein [Verrucomicrobia bacterium]|jgi:glycosyltransferase involved in cell wall biosynthesis|nr:glycosyltransferase family 2 protein [Verrucomicrobiota bacterium]